MDFTFFYFYAGERVREELCHRAQRVVGITKSEDRKVQRADYEAYLLTVPSGSCPLQGVLRSRSGPSPGLGINSSARELTSFNHSS